MNKITNYNDWKIINENTAKKLSIRFDNHYHDKKKNVMVCGGTGCIASKSQNIHSLFVNEVKKRSLNNTIDIIKTGCFGFCKMGPIVVIHPDKTFYCNVTPDDVEEIIDKHLIDGNIIDRLLYTSPITKKVQQTMQDIDFFADQIRNILINCGKINPENIDEYIGVNGYKALCSILSNKTIPEEIIDTIKSSGLRGRGGGGFPTGKKWEMAKNVVGDTKYVLCNADEGDPGAFMDRSILEGDPHSVIEAMIIAGYCIGAKKGYIYIRAEYPIAIKRLKIAIKQAQEKGLLGKNILSSKFDFSINIRLGAGAFVCGEETALIKSVMGKRGEPRPRPPYPVVKGLWDCPTLNNNVETFANIPIILRNGSDWYSSIGTDDSKGTKVFALAGQIQNTGLIEVPMGTTIDVIVNKIGGGTGNKKFKAIQSGGPSGGCIPKEHIHTKVDYKSLTEIGSMMGSGGIIVMDESDCMVDIARYYVEFAQHESCGKCVPCSIGTQRILEILTRITKGDGKISDLDSLVRLCTDVKNSSLCGLGQSAPNPVLSTLKYFKDEYISHINEKICPAKICTALLKIVIDREKCISCGICAKICPVSAITGKQKQEAYIINPDICIKCNACIHKCPVAAIDKH